MPFLGSQKLTCTLTWAKSHPLSCLSYFKQLTCQYLFQPKIRKMSFPVCSKCHSMPVCAISCFLCVGVLCRTCAAVSEEELALLNSAGSSLKFLCPDCQTSFATCPKDVEDLKQAYLSKELEILECRNKILSQSNAVKLFISDVDRLLSLLEHQQSKLERLENMNERLTSTLRQLQNPKPTATQESSVEENNGVLLRAREQHGKLMNLISTVESEHCSLWDDVLKTEAELKSCKSTNCELKSKLDDVVASNVLLEKSVAKLGSELQDSQTQQAREEKQREELTELYNTLYDRERKLRSKVSRHRENQQTWKERFNKLREEHKLALTNADSVCLLLMFLLIISVFLNLYKLVF